MTIKLIRNSVFETNSSSCHSISLGASHVFNDTIVPDSEGNITLTPGEFGWEICDYTDAETKLQYAWTWAKNYAQDSDSAIEYLTNLVCEYTGAKAIAYTPDSCQWCKDGYIDHQSEDVMKDIFYDSVKLKEFLFCSGSVLHTDNDNH